MTGSVMRWADFSISIEYCLPVPISQLVEYQLVRPRLLMVRTPMESTSSSLPFLMCGSSASPGEGSTSVFGADAVVLFLDDGLVEEVLSPGFAGASGLAEVSGDWLGAGSFGLPKLGRLGSAGGAVESAAGGVVAGAVEGAGVLEG